MENNRETLKQILDAIKIKGTRKGIDISEGEMAQKLNFSKENFDAYLNGEEDIPNDLSSQLTSAYNLKIVQVSHVSTEHVSWELPEDDN